MHAYVCAHMCICLHVCAHMCVSIFQVMCSIALLFSFLIFTDIVCNYDIIILHFNRLHWLRGTVFLYTTIIKFCTTIIICLKSLTRFFALQPLDPKRSFNCFSRSCLFSFASSSCWGYVIMILSRAYCNTHFQSISYFFLGFLFVEGCKPVWLYGE